MNCIPFAPYSNNCGHAPMMEKPERFNELLEAFLEEVEGKMVEAV
jgi:hypothetical protein